MIKNRDEKVLMVHCWIHSLVDFGFDDRQCYHIIHEHFLPLVNFKEEYGIVYAEAIKEIEEEIAEEIAEERKSMEVN